MSIEVFRPEPTVSDVAVTINDLIRTINHEYHQANASVLESLTHALTCGDALIAAKALVPDGDWTEWCNANIDMGRSTIARWCRLARYKHLILVPDGPTSIRSAQAYMAILDVPDLRTRGRFARWDVDLAKRLRDGGLSYIKIGEIVGASKGAVQYKLDPKFKERRDRMAKAATEKRKQQRNAARRAFSKEMQNEAVKKHGGTPAEAYAILRRCALVADRAIAESEDAEYRGAMRAALAYVHKAEDQIVRALRIGRQT